MDVSFFRSTSWKDSPRRPRGTDAAAPGPGGPSGALAHGGSQCRFHKYRVVCGCARDARHAREAERRRTESVRALRGPDAHEAGQRASWPPHEVSNRRFRQPRQRGVTIAQGSSVRWSCSRINEPDVNPSRGPAAHLRVSPGAPAKSGGSPHRRQARLAMGWRALRTASPALH